MTIASSLATVLAAHTDHAFGVMGEGNAAFLHHYEEAGKPVTPVRHESAAVAAADVYYRASGKLAVATCTYGAGFTNTLTTLVEAAKAHIPLVLVTGGEGPVTKPWDISETAVLTSLSIPYVVADENPETVARVVRTAHELSTPVAIIITDTTASLEAAEPTEDQLAPIEPVRPEISETALDEIVTALGGASRPLILAGRGMWAGGATEIFTEIAGRIGAQVATTAAARNIFDGAPICGGFASEATAAEIAKADVILAVGASLTPFTMRFGEAFGGDAVLIQATITPSHFHPRATIHLAADARDLGLALLDRLEPATREHAPLQASLDEVEEARDDKAHPAEIAIRLNEILPAERTVVSDGGHFIGWPATMWDVPDPAAFIQIGTAFKAIGMGTGGAAGAAHARHDRTTVLVTGDGGLAMCLADLPTLVEAPGRKIVVVFNDGVYGAEHHQFAHLGLSMTMGGVGALDLAAVARGCGADGLSVTSVEELDEVGNWIASHDSGTLLVDCHVSHTVLAPFFAEIVKRAAR